MKLCVCREMYDFAETRTTVFNQNQGQEKVFQIAGGYRQGKSDSNVTQSQAT